MDMFGGGDEGERRMLETSRNICTTLVGVVVRVSNMRQSLKSLRSATVLDID